MDVVIVLFDVSMPSTLDSAIATWTKELQDNGLRMPTLLVGSKIDIREKGLTDGVLWITSHVLRHYLSNSREVSQRILT